MTKKTAILSAVFALGVMFVGAAEAGADKNGGGKTVTTSCGGTCSGGGSGGNPPGYGNNWGGPVTGHGKNGHSHGQVNNGSSGGNGSSPYVDRVVCVIGPRVAYVQSVRTCRRLVHAYKSGYGYGEGGSIVYQSTSGHGVSKATRMQHKKRYAKAHRSKVRHGHVTRVRSRSGNTYNINNYGTININKGGAW